MCNKDSNWTSDTLSGSHIDKLVLVLSVGLGVDDMFVIIEAWNNLTALQKRKDLKVKIAIAMQHAGVSITVTSITDFVAFAIGASSVSNLYPT